MRQKSDLLAAAPLVLVERVCTSSNMREAYRRSQASKRPTREGTMGNGGKGVRVEASEDERNEGMRLGVCKYGCGRGN